VRPALERHTSQQTQSCINIARQMDAAGLHVPQVLQFAR
jgi:hypothetical protein